jgi:hypothetical protein
VNIKISLEDETSIKYDNRKKRFATKSVSERLKQIEIKIMGKVARSTQKLVIHNIDLGYFLNAQVKDASHSDTVLLKGKTKLKLNYHLMMREVNWRESVPSLLFVSMIDESHKKCRQSIAVVEDSMDDTLQGETGEKKQKANRSMLAMEGEENSKKRKEKTANSNNQAETKDVEIDLKSQRKLQRANRPPMATSRPAKQPAPGKTYQSTTQLYTADQHRAFLSHTSRGSPPPPEKPASRVSPALAARADPEPWPLASLAREFSEEIEMMGRLLAERDEEIARLRRGNELFRGAVERMERDREIGEETPRRVLRFQGREGAEEAAISIYSRLATSLDPLVSTIVYPPEPLTPDLPPGPKPISHQLDSLISELSSLIQKITAPENTDNYSGELNKLWPLKSQLDVLFKPVNNVEDVKQEDKNTDTTKVTICDVSTLCNLFLKETNDFGIQVQCFGRTRRTKRQVEIMSAEEKEKPDTETNSNCHEPPEDHSPPMKPSRPIHLPTKQSNSSPLAKPDPDTDSITKAWPEPREKGDRSRSLVSSKGRQATQQTRPEGLVAVQVIVSSRNQESMTDLEPVQEATSGSQPLSMEPLKGLCIAAPAKPKIASEAAMPVEAEAWEWKTRGRDVDNLGQLYSVVNEARGTTTEEPTERMGQAGREGLDAEVQTDSMGMASVDSVGTQTTGMAVCSDESTETEQEGREGSGKRGEMEGVTFQARRQGRAAARGEQGEVGRLLDNKRREIEFQTKIESIKMVIYSAISEEEEGVEGHEKAGDGDGVGERGDGKGREADGERRGSGGGGDGDREGTGLQATDEGNEDIERSPPTEARQSRYGSNLQSKILESIVEVDESRSQYTEESPAKPSPQNPGPLLNSQELDDGSTPSRQTHLDRIRMLESRFKEYQQTMTLLRSGVLTQTASTLSTMGDKDTRGHEEPPETHLTIQDDQTPVPTGPTPPDPPAGLHLPPSPPSPSNPLHQSFSPSLPEPKDPIANSDEAMPDEDNLKGLEASKSSHFHSSHEDIRIVVTRPGNERIAPKGIIVDSMIDHIEADHRSLDRSEEPSPQKEPFGSGDKCVAFLEKDYSHVEVVNIEDFISLPVKDLLTKDCKKKFRNRVSEEISQGRYKGT